MMSLDDDRQAQSISTGGADGTLGAGPLLMEERATLGGARSARFVVSDKKHWPESVGSFFGPGNKNFYYVFDFDGVVASQTEEQIYRLHPEPGEREALVDIARHYKIDASGYDTRYLRHLVVQEILLSRGSPVEIGPLAAAASALSRDGQAFFILTARSGRAAVKRALDFLENHRIFPQELFFVGRAPKGRQLLLARESVGNGLLVYFDDSHRHARNSRRQEMDDFTTVFVDWTSQDSGISAKALYDSCIKWFCDNVGKDVQ